MLYDRFGLLAADFETYYRIDLLEKWWDRGFSWRMFITRMFGLPSGSMTKLWLTQNTNDAGGGSAVRRKPTISAENAESYMVGVFGGR